MLSTLQEIKD
ncbi:unnamed protein product [Cuscuta europaea]|uniref:Uncharacterized protein n=2 Tax=Cuscuta subgen. Cuscuta TaxID=1824621 RepID=A0A9P1EPJ8_CUSEU|nr:unnamed protein product [Cuscuta epithymum]CAH9120569.1 unnamed protein product [Cuscuta europaea]